MKRVIRLTKFGYFLVTKRRQCENCGHTTEILVGPIKDLAEYKALVKVLPH